MRRFGSRSIAVQVSASVLLGLIAVASTTPAKAFFILIDDGCVIGPMTYCSAVRTGLRKPILYECLVDTARRDTDGGSAQYLFEGHCALTFEPSITWPFDAAAVHEQSPGDDQGETVEFVTLYRGEDRTSELGEISTVLACKADPFADAHAECALINHYNSSGADVLSTHQPLLRGMGADDGPTAEQDNPLTVGEGELQWDPHFSPQKRKWIRIVMPSNEYSSIPSYSGTYRMRVRNVASSVPSRFEVQLEKARLVQQVGDIAIASGQLYPESWHPVIPAPFDTTYLWSELREFKDGSRVLPLRVGDGPQALSPGMYRMRFRVRYPPLPWTDWQKRWWHFWVGPGIPAARVNELARDLKAQKPKASGIETRGLSPEAAEQLQRTLTH